MAQTAPGIYIAQGTPEGGFKAFGIGEGLLGYDLSHQVWGGSGDQDDFEELAASVLWLWACYRIRADKLSTLPRTVTMASNDEPIEEKEIPFEISVSDMLWRTEYSLLVHGYAYWMKKLSKRKSMKLGDLRRVNGKVEMKLADGQDVNLHSVRWLDPLSIEPLVNEIDGLYGFKRQLRNSYIIYRINPATGIFDDLLYFWLPGMREAAPGFGISSVVNDAAHVLRNIDRYSDNFFNQGGMPITLLMLPKNTRNEERKKLESRFERLASGVRNAFKPIAINSEVTVQRLGLNPGEVGMPALEEQKRDAILAATGVPLAVVLGKAANYATARQDAQNLISYTIEPRAELIQDIVNKQLLEPLGYRLNFRAESLPEMKQDEREAAAAVKDLTDSGITPEAALYFLGYDLELPEGVLLTQTIDVDDMKDEDETPDRDERAADLARWQKKAIKAYRRGEGANVSFTSEHIDIKESSRIIAGLATATDEREVRAAFVDAPFRHSQPAPIHFKGYP